MTDLTETERKMFYCKDKWGQFCFFRENIFFFHNYEKGQFKSVFYSVQHTVEVLPKQTDADTWTLDRHLQEKIANKWQQRGHKKGRRGVFWSFPVIFWAELRQWRKGGRGLNRGN